MHTEAGHPSWCGCESFRPTAVEIIHPGHCQVEVGFAKKKPTQRVCKTSDLIAHASAGVPGMTATLAYALHERFFGVLVFFC